MTQRSTWPVARRTRVNGRRNTRQNQRGMMVLVAEEMEAGSGLTVTTNHSSVSDLAIPRYASRQLLAIAREALYNVRRHSGSRAALVSLTRPRPDVLRLSVKDRGRGLPAQATVSGGLGLLGMRERAALIGAQMTIASGSNRGTTVRVEFALSST